MLRKLLSWLTRSESRPRYDGPAPVLHGTKSLAPRNDPVPAKREFSVGVYNYEWDSQYVSLPSEQWERELKPRAESIARRQEETKAAVAALREERKQTKAMWNAVRMASRYHELASRDKLEYRQRKEAHDTRLKEIRERENSLRDKLKSIKSEWREHYDDIRARREAVIEAVETATEESLRNENRWYFFLYPGERVKTIADCRFLDAGQHGFGEVLVRAGSTGVVSSVEKVKKGRYTFSIWFGAGKNEVLPNHRTIFCPE